MGTIRELAGVEQVSGVGNNARARETRWPPKAERPDNRAVGTERFSASRKTFFPCAEFWGGGKVAWPRHLADLNRGESPFSGSRPGPCGRARQSFCVYVRTRRKEDRRAARKDKVEAELAAAREQEAHRRRKRAGRRAPAEVSDHV